MRKISLLIFFILFSNQIYSTNIPLDSIKQVIVDFWNKNELGIYNVEQHLHISLIIEVRTNKGIEEGVNGVFRIKAPSSHAKMHFVLIDDRSINILNMKELWYANLSLLIDFFSRNTIYTKDNVLEYMQEFYEVGARNKF